MRNTSKFFFAILLAILSAVAYADTFPLPTNARITWVDDGKGNAVVSWTGVEFSSVAFFVGNGKAWGNKKVVAVAGKNVAIMEDYKKNGLRFNGQRGGLWAHLDCPAAGQQYSNPALGNGLVIDCSWIDPSDGMPKGAVQLSDK
jgi:hypothetical protein